MNYYESTTCSATRWLPPFCSAPMFHTYHRTSRPCGQLLPWLLSQSCRSCLSAHLLREPRVSSLLLNASANNKHVQPAQVPAIRCLRLRKAHKLLERLLPRTVGRYGCPTSQRRRERGRCDDSDQRRTYMSSLLRHPIAHLLIRHAASQRSCG